MSSKWSQEQTYQFVAEYMKYPCLYNVKSKLHKNKTAREDALKNISKCMNLSNFGVREVYTKIRNIRSTYSQEVRKTRESKSSGDSEDIYIPNLKWFHLMDNTLKRQHVDNQEIPNNIKEEQREVDMLEEYEDELESPAKIVRKEISDFNDTFDKAKDISDSRNSIPSGRNEFDIFGSSVAAQLKRMPLGMALQCQMFIQNYLSNKRLQQIGDFSQSVSPSTTSSPLYQQYLSPPLRSDTTNYIDNPNTQDQYNNSNFPVEDFEQINFIKTETTIQGE